MSVHSLNVSVPVLWHFGSNVLETYCAVMLRHVLPHAKFFSSLVSVSAHLSLFLPPSLPFLLIFLSSYLPLSLSDRVSDLVQANLELRTLPSPRV